MEHRILSVLLFIAVVVLARRSKGMADLKISLAFVVEPKDVFRVRGKNLTLPCSAEGATNITWNHNGRPLNLVSDTRRKVLSDGSLFFRKLIYKKTGSQISDEGEYRCVAHNAEGSIVSRPAQLQNPVLPLQFKEFPNDTTVEEDNSVRFTCQIESVPKAVISWIKNDKPLPHSTRFIVLDDYLYITRAKQSDAGLFRCKAVNVITKKERISKDGSLEVTEKSSQFQPPQFLSPVESLKVLEGKDTTLHCVAKGSPNPKISWSFQPTPNGPGRPVFVTETVSSVVRLKNVTVSQTGNYTCTATNYNSEGVPFSITQVIELNVLVPPSFLVTPVPDVGPTAKTVRFNCSASGVPQPKILWMKDGEPIIINGRVKQTEYQLVISSTVKNESGLYQCLAINQVGEISSVTKLMVNGSEFSPDIPRDVTCRTLSPTQIALSWDAPEKHIDEFRAYTYHHLPTDGGEEKAGVTRNKTAIVEKLLPYKNYTFYIRVYSFKAASEPSDKVICQTFEGVPQAAPEITLNPISSSTLHVLWTPLPKDRSYGVITEYKVQWRREGQHSSHIEIVPESFNEYTITGLDPGQRYSVRVLAATNKGWPSDDKLPWYTVEMPPSEEVDVPVAPVVQLAVATSTSVQVSWSLSPEAKYKPTGYKLYYRKQNGAAIDPIFLPPNSTQYLLTDLEPQTMYEVLVTAQTPEGDSKEGSQTIHTLPPISVQADLNSTFSLLPPTNIDAEPTSSTSINVTWTPAAVQDTDIAYYLICYNVVKTSLVLYNSSSTCVRSTNLHMEMQGLSRGTVYEFKIRSHDINDNYGPFSRTVECRTYSHVPGMVSDVEWRPLNSNTVMVTWKEPRMLTGHVSSYEIAYSSNDSVPIPSWNLIRLPAIQNSVEINGLMPNKIYVMVIRAVSQTGPGEYTTRIPISIPVVKTTSPTKAPETTKEADIKMETGAVIGVAIGMVLIIICVTGIILWRKRAARRESLNEENPPNGNGYYYDWERSQAGNEMEMDNFTPGSNTSPDSQPTHLDTKGGYPNGQANGLKHPLLRNGRVSTGKGPVGNGPFGVHNVRITENPQYVRSSASKSERNSQSAAEHSEPLLESELRKEAGSNQEICGGDDSEEADITQDTVVNVSVMSNEPHNDRLSRIKKKEELEPT